MDDDPRLDPAPPIVRGAFWLAVAGFLLGVPVSYWLQPDNVHGFFAANGGLGQYFIALTNEQATWSSLEASEWAETWQFLKPVLLASSVLTVLGAILGWIVGRPRVRAAATA